MQRAIAAVAVLAMLVVTSPSRADPRKSDTHNQPASVRVNADHSYGAAGCGLGSVLFGASPGFNQLLSATTNGTFYSQIYGITSGTSNCEETRPTREGARIFIVANREAIAKDISRGRGETIASLATLARCPDAGAVGLTLQRSYKAIFPNAAVTTEVVAERILTTLQRDESLACGAD